MTIQSTAETPKDKLTFHYLPDFATFVLANHFEDYVKEQLLASRQEDIPLLKFFAHMPEDALMELSRKSNREFLIALQENQARDYIVRSAEDYMKNRISFLEREQVVAEDITIATFIRRKTLRKFLAMYTNDIALFGQVMEELDRFVAENEAASFNAYLHIQQEKISGINAVLEQRENELLEAQELADMGSFLWDLQGKGNSSFTPGVMRIFEMTETSNLDSFVENVHEDDRQKLRDAITRSLEQDGIYECEYRFIKNQKIKIIWSRGKVTFMDGKPIHMKGTIIDVTKRNLLLQQLQESEQLHKQAQALTHIGNWVWEIDTNHIEWSDEMYRIYGLEPQSERINFDRFISLVHPDDRESRIKEIQQSLATGIAEDYLLRIVNPDGKIKFLRGKGQVITGHDQKPVRLVGTCQDITRAHQLNVDLQEKEAYLKQVITNAPDSVIVIDETSTITLWNPKTEEIFGWTSDEVVGKDLSETIIPLQYREGHHKGMKRLLDTGVGPILNKTLSITAVHKDGHEFFISLTISQFVQRGSSSFIAFIRDITVEKQTQDELKEKTYQLEELNEFLEFKNVELERMNKELESFNYIASHDLQEPLRKIQIFTNRILEKEYRTLNASTIEYLDKIGESSSRMKKLIEDLLTFSQASSHDSQFEMTDLNVILDEAKNAMLTSAEDKKVIIENTSLPKLKVVPFQIQQVFSNLLMNAIKYSKPGITPHIKISSELLTGDQLKIRGAVLKKHYAEIRFEDNGIGFDESQADKIFGLFYRLHSKEKYSGTGIGLAICKKMVQNHNGFIVARSTPQVGSVFSIYLPIEKT